MNVLHNAGATLADGRYFSLLDWEYEYPRKKILECSDPQNEYRREIEQAMYHRDYKLTFMSTATRLSLFRSDIPKAFYGTHEGIDLSWCIKNDAIILVNFFRDKLDALPHRFLGTIFINQILRAIKDLNRQGWVRPFFLMMDEAARLGTEELGELLAYWRQAGLRVVLGHQFFGQFDDFPKLLHSINSNCRHEVMFDVQNPEDRLNMVARFYGGKIPDREAEFYMRDLKPQHAIIKLSNS
jgi:hypothetical protein